MIPKKQLITPLKVMVAGSVIHRLLGSTCYTIFRYMISKVKNYKDENFNDWNTNIDFFKFKKSRKDKL